MNAREAAQCILHSGIGRNAVNCITAQHAFISVAKGLTWRSHCHGPFINAAQRCTSKRDHSFAERQVRPIELSGLPVDPLLHFALGNAPNLHHLRDFSTRDNLHNHVEYRSSIERYVSFVFQCKSEIGVFLIFYTKFIKYVRSLFAIFEINLSRISVWFLGNTWFSQVSFEEATLLRELSVEANEWRGLMNENEKSKVDAPKFFSQAQFLTGRQRNHVFKNRTFPCIQLSPNGSKLFYDQCLVTLPIS